MGKKSRDNQSSEKKRNRKENKDILYLLAYLIHLLAIKMMIALKAQKPIMIPEERRKIRCTLAFHH